MRVRLLHQYKSPRFRFRLFIVMLQISITFIFDGLFLSYQMYLKIVNSKDKLIERR